MTKRPTILGNKGSTTVLSRLGLVTSLEVAIELIENCDEITDEESDRIIRSLYHIISIVQKKVWSKEDVFAYCDKLEEQYGGVARLHFFNANAPSVSTIKDLFGMGVTEFIDAYYPKLTDTQWKAKYKSIDWREEFRNEYYRIMPKSLTEFDARRRQGFPSAHTIMKYFQLKRYSDLLKFCNIEKPNQRTKFKITSSCHSQEMIEMLNSKQ